MKGKSETDEKVKMEKKEVRIRKDENVIIETKFF